MTESKYGRLFSKLWLILFISWGILTFFLCTLIEAQYLRSEVSFDLTKLPETKQKRVEVLQETIREYIDNSNWTDTPLDIEIPLTLTMSLTDRSEAHEDRYGVQLQVTNKRDIQYKDRYGFFPYQMNDPLYRDDNSYEPLTGLIDFYVYMILGGEMDKRAILGGTPFYQKAQEVCENAGFGRSEFHQGWDERKDIIDKILSEEWDTFRKLKAIFFKAKVLYNQGHGNKARQYCRVVVLELGKMFDTNSEDERVKEFLKYHYFEIGELFKDKTDPALFQRLIELDSDHRDEYEKYLD